MLCTSVLYGSATRVQRLKSGCRPSSFLFFYRKLEIQNIKVRKGTGGFFPKTQARNCVEVLAQQQQQQQQHKHQHKHQHHHQQSPSSSTITITTTLNNNNIFTTAATAASDCYCDGDGDANFRLLENLSCNNVDDPRSVHSCHRQHNCRDQHQQNGRNVDSTSTVYSSTRAMSTALRSKTSAHVLVKDRWTEIITSLQLRRRSKQGTFATVPAAAGQAKADALRQAPHL